MEVINRISSPTSESWVAWVLLILSIGWVLKKMFVPELIMVFRGMFSRGERSYVATGGQMKYLTQAFRIGIIALLIQLVLQTGCGFLLTDYCIVVGVVSLVLLVQRLMIQLTGVVFLSHRMFETAIEQRTMINEALCCLMPVIVVLLCFAHTLNTPLVILLAILYMGLILVKSIQLFYNNLLSVIYILLYVISLEFIPMACAMVWIKNIVQ